MMEKVAKFFSKASLAKYKNKMTDHEWPEQSSMG